MSRFTVRDVLWLTLAIGLALGWILDHLNMEFRNTANRNELTKQLLDRSEAWREAEEEARLSGSNWKVNDRLSVEPLIA